MNFSYPINTINEGKATIFVPKLTTLEHSPRKAPVFFNPIMELNRDLAILALRIYQRMLGREILVCEPLTGCGIRGIRVAVEVEKVRKVFVNDISLEAARLARLNVERNELTSSVLVKNEDANFFLSRHMTSQDRFDFIDVDPFGSPVPYLDATIKALRNGGFLALTATDMAPLCGIHPKACIRKYGGKPLRTKYCHEIAIRLLIGCLIMMAAKYKMAGEIVFSHSTDHYVRVYAIVRRGASIANKSIEMMGYILHCFSCLHREISKGMTSHLRERVCAECGSKLNIAGPLWLGKLANSDFCNMMKNEVDAIRTRQKKRILKLISLVRNEVEAPVTYYVVDKICDDLNLPVPPLMRVIENLERSGFKTTLTHFNSRGFRTDAPISLINVSIRAAISASEGETFRFSRRHIQSPPEGAS